MTAWVYLGFLVAAFVAFGVWLDRRWKSYAAGCDACLGREDALAKLVAEEESRVRTAAHVDSALAGLVSVAPVIPLQRDGRDS